MRITAHKPWWLLPRYAVAQPVIAAVALLLGVAAATAAAYVLHTGPMVVAAAAMLACSSAGYSLHELRVRLLDRINGGPQVKLKKIILDIEANAIARYRAQTAPEQTVDALLAAIMPADSTSPDHHSARDGVR